VFHNRLTHSLQVAQVGRALAEKLADSQRELADALGGINPDAVEAACLAHDLGHPPFGHTAEEELNDLSKERIGGFEGNAQSFRIVTKLAFKSEKGGLDLTRATLAATLKYPWLRNQNKEKADKWGAYDSELDDFNFARELDQKKPFRPTAEAQLMDWADDVTYSVHDLEDFYRAGRIPMDLLAGKKEGQRLRFFDDVYQRNATKRNFYPRAELEEAFGNILAWFWRLDEPYTGTSEHRSLLRYTTSKLIHRFVDAVTIDAETQSIKINEEQKKEVAILKELTWTYVIEGPALAMQREGQKRIIQNLFDVYSSAALTRKRWSLFPPYYRDRLEKSESDQERQRTVVDLIAGMTEPQAIASYAQVMGVRPSLSLEEIVQ
jgi:dGTPase